MSWYYYNTFYLANSQKGTLRWREKCGEKQDFPDTWPGRDTLQVLFIRKRNEAQDLSAQSLRKELCSLNTLPHTAGLLTGTSVW